MHAADFELPAEEIDIFLRQHVRVQSVEKGLDAVPAESAGPVSDPFSVAPAEFG